MSGKTFRNILTLTSQFAFCGLPIRLDSYVGCSFKCHYCFAWHRGGATAIQKIRAAHPRALERVFEWTFDRPREKAGIVGQFLWRRVPIHFGGMSDPFQPAENHFGVSRSFLGTLARYEYPVVLSTKSLLVSSVSMLPALQAMKHLVVQFSLCSTQDDIAAKYDGSAPAPSRILRTIELLSKAGIPVTVRWQPFIPGASENPQEFVERVVSAGALHVGLEHLKVPVEGKSGLALELQHSSGVDFGTVYRRMSAMRDGRELVLRPIDKIEVSLEARSACRTRGITFGAADNEIQYLSDTNCCCSGVDQFPGFENWFKHQVGFAVRKCIGKPITYQSIAHEWAPAGSIDRFLNSRTRLAARTGVEGTLRNHLRHRWNTLGAPGNPRSFLGVVSTERRTSAGNLVYEWSHRST